MCDIALSVCVCVFFFFFFKDRGNALFKEVHEEKALKGRANDAVAAACLYMSCRLEEVPRSFKGTCVMLERKPYCFNTAGM